MKHCVHYFNKLHYHVIFQCSFLTFVIYKQIQFNTLLSGNFECQVCYVINVVSLVVHLIIFIQEVLSNSTVFPIFKLFTMSEQYMKT